MLGIYVYCCSVCLRLLLSGPLFRGACTLCRSYDILSSLTYDCWMFRETRSSYHRRDVFRLVHISLFTGPHTPEISYFWRKETKTQPAVFPSQAFIEQAWSAGPNSLQPSFLIPSLNPAQLDTGLYTRAKAVDFGWSYEQLQCLSPHNIWGVSFKVPWMVAG